MNVLDDKDKIIDHINHITYDNRKKNLRICTHQQNHFNRSIVKTNTSGYTGVRSIKNNRWQAVIKINNKQINLGSFINKEDAINARKEAEIKYFGEFRYKEE